MTDTWPAVFYQKSITSDADATDTIEVPVDTLFLIDFITFSTNNFIGDSEKVIVATIAVNGVNVYQLDIQIGSFIGVGSLELPLQGFVVPGGSFLTFRTFWDPTDSGVTWFDWFVGGRVTPSPVFVGISESAPPH